MNVGNEVSEMWIYSRQWRHLTSVRQVELDTADLFIYLQKLLMYLSTNSPYQPKIREMCYLSSLNKSLQL